MKSLRRTFDVPSRSAGSEGDVQLANMISDEFKALNLESWVDVHYVQLQKPDRLRFLIPPFSPPVY